ncbi:MAG: HD domain-containing protein [Acidobacteriota bacterium]|jgi:HD superfamily phosphodiesterase|nr:HD domain-containing protein [Acidobacteriota bacterium]
MMRRARPSKAGKTADASAQSYGRLVQARLPGLLDRIRETVEALERAYEGKGAATGPGGESHLWEHTAQVASLTFKLARMEGMDDDAALVPVLAALFHDAGKFAGGEYHGGDTAEEEESAKVARRLLGGTPLKPAELRAVLGGLGALYNEKSPKNRVAALVHDADFLSKFGAMGVAAFFTKATLRGRSMHGAMLGHLSKELTYAACLPGNMRTAAGRRMAAGKARDSLGFFRKLLRELRDAGVADLRVRKLRIQDPRAPRAAGRRLEILLAASPVCPRCHAPWEAAWSTAEGVKCTKLDIDWHCADCGESLETSFCLPEV